MIAKKVNYSFLGYVVLEYLVIILLMTVLYFVDLENLFINTFLSEGLIAMPFVIGLLVSKNERPVCERLGIKKMKWTTLGAVILYGIVISPIGTFANALSMVFVDNEMLKSSSYILDANFVGAMLCSAIIAPLVEETAFRGYMYNGYRKDGARISAVLLSAIAFAFMHMNFNQAAYAFVVGIAFAFVVEATGSIWSSIICHLMFNGESIITMFLGELIAPGMYDDISVDKNEILSLIPPYAVAAVVATVIAAFIIKWIAKNENRQDMLGELFSKNVGEYKKAKIVTWPIVVALLFCFAFMVMNV